MLVEPELLKQVVELSSLSPSESKRSIQAVKGLVVCEKIASLTVLTKGGLDKEFARVNESVLLELRRKALDLGANLVLSVHLDHSIAQAHAGLGDAFFKSDTGSLLLSVIARGEAVVAE
ncbi:hypothetical protein CGT98_18000 [Vibrio metoecus]|uniref:hypothetical protein n=1 Tax=Vibrio metoecus TaxID=1481663 RepID=UPI000BA970AD|nr:hypothetical protein [Vibrio metoecus]GHZ70826.1 hypothetical protein VCSRO175_3466 [Vibrio cholerae]PAR33811.1 hypothetical protein CGT97_19240 [Vibrio metoecus]PAR34987.1 hypothetical protein CGT98_18000 [Vibrio metoecus]PAR41185.1 hypothetical protein CGT96_17000 [Vibrio metoecus]PAR44085.1 hypothetical protein CGT95_17885 [Vibrio metoecus]